MCISGIYAFSNTSILLIKNDINTGAVNIELQEYTIIEGKEALYEDSGEQSVVPGQVISLIPRITNSGDSCYVRAKVKYEDEKNITKILAESNIDNSSNNWVKKGDYWYYKDILKPGEHVDLFNKLTIPKDMSNDQQGKILQLNIIAEAIQSENFNPDFNSESPWKDIKVEKATSESYKMDKVQLNSTVKIEYENNAELYMEVPDEFFSRLGHVLPGDTLSQKITINNTTSGEVEYFVSTDKVDGISDKEIELLKKLNLRISNGSKVLYEGSVYPLDKISLGSYNSKATSDITFTITVPSELGNEYSNLNTAMKWRFTVSGKDKVIPDNPKPVVPSPQTGDTKVQIAFALFFISAIGLIVILFAERRYKKN